MVKILKEKPSKFFTIIFWIVALIFWLGGTYYLLEWSTRQRAVVTLLVAIIILGGLILLLWWIRKNPLTQQNFGIYPTISLPAQLIGIVLSAMYVMATMSYALHRMNIIKYVTDKTINFDQFLHYYGWHLLDSIPVLQITKNFNVPLHVKAESGYELGAGFLLLVFKIGIIAWSISLFRGKRKNLHKT